MTSVAAQRKVVLDDFADGKLQEKATAEAYREEEAEYARTDDRRRSNLLQRRKALEGERQSATQRAERTFAMFLEAVTEIHDLAAAEAKVAAALGMGTLGLGQKALAKRLTGYMSHELRKLPSATLGDFGNFKLVGNLPMGAKNWIEAEKFIIRNPEKEIGK